MASSGFAGRIKGANTRRGFAYRKKAKKALGELNADGTPKVPENPLAPDQIHKNTLDDKWLQQETLKQLLITETKRVKAKFEEARNEARQRTSSSALQGVLDAINTEEKAALKQIGDYSSLIEVGDIRTDVKGRYIKNFLAWLTGNGTPLEVAVTPWGRKYAGNDSVSQLIGMYPERRSQFIVSLAKLDLHKPRTMQEWMIYYKYFINPINREDVRRRIAKDLNITHDQFPNYAAEVTKWVKEHMEEFIEDDFLKDWEVFFINDQQKVDDKKVNQTMRTQQFYGAHEMSLPEEDKHLPFDVSNEYRGYRLTPQGRPSPEDYVPGDVGPEYGPEEAPERARVEMGEVGKSTDTEKQKETETARKLPPDVTPEKGKEKVEEGDEEAKKIQEPETKEDKDYATHEKAFIKATVKGDDKAADEAAKKLLELDEYPINRTNIAKMKRALMRKEEISERVREKQYEKARRGTETGKKMASLLPNIGTGEIGALTPEEFSDKVKAMGITQKQLEEFVGPGEETVSIPGTEDERRTLSAMERAYEGYKRQRKKMIAPLMTKGSEYLTVEKGDVDVDESNLEAVHREGGKGVYSRKEIEKDRTIGVYQGRVLTREQVEALPEETQNDYIFDAGSGLFIDGNPAHIETGAMRWVGIINSPYKTFLKPNVTFSIDEADGSVKVTTLRKIYPGEELLARYGSAYWRGTEKNVPDDILSPSDADPQERRRYESVVAGPETTAFYARYNAVEETDPSVRALRDEIVDINNILYYSKFEEVAKSYQQLNHLRSLMLADLERKLGIPISDPTTVAEILGIPWRSSQMYASEYPEKFKKSADVEIEEIIPKEPVTVPTPTPQPTDLDERIGSIADKSLTSGSLAAAVLLTEHGIKIGEATSQQEIRDALREKFKVDKSWRQEEKRANMRRLAKYVEGLIKSKKT